MTKSSELGTRKLNLIKKAIERLPLPPEGRKQIYYTDTQTRGLEVGVTGAGTKSFVYRRKVGGISRRKFLGLFPDMSIEQARGKAAELNAAFVRGENPFDDAKAAREQMTLGELFERYIQHNAKKKGERHPVIRQEFERIAATLKNRKLSAISQIDAEKLHSDLGKGRGHYSANRAIQLLRAVYNIGIKLKLYCGDNPFAGIELFDEHPRERFLSDEEAGRLLKALDDESNRPLHDFIVLGLFTGARKSNVLSMQFTEIDWDAGTWTIPADKMKTRKKQVIALGGTEIALLKARSDSQDGDFVFPGTGKTGHLMDLKRSWTTLRKRARLTDDSNVTIHDLRRSLGAAMANANVNVALVKGALNHKDVKTTLAHYAHTSKQAELQARELVQSRWIQAAEQAPEKDNVLPLRQDVANTSSQ